MNKENKMQLLSVTLTTQLLNFSLKDVYHGLYQLKIENKPLILPYNQNGNHFCLAVADPVENLLLS